MPPIVRLDTDPLQTPVDVDSISGRSEMFTSAHLPSAVAGINRDSRHPALYAAAVVLCN